MTRRWTFRLIAAAWMLVGLWAIVVGGSTRAKAEVAQWLIADSWRRGSESHHALRPWPWSDVRVAARLQVPALDETRYVMDGDSGEALAFGPGYSSVDPTTASTLPTVISGHRDTHFAFLGQVESGMDLTLENTRGDIRRFRVSRLAVVDSRGGRLPMGVAREDLLLVTCYPLGALVPGGPLRLVLIAKPVRKPVREPPSLSL